MLRNLICETTNNPGNSATVSLAGAVAGFGTFSSAFTNGNLAFYTMTDSATNREWGYATVTPGTPDQLTSRTCIGNSNGTTSRLNFTGSVTIFNGLPAENAIYRNSSRVVLLDGSLTITDTGNSNGANLTMTGNGVTTPSKYIRIRSGVMEFVNSAYTTIIASLTDAGAWACNQIAVAFAGSDALTLTQSGANPASGLVVHVSNTSSPLAFFYLNSTGVGSITTNGSATAYNTTSDYRLKNLYGPSDGSLIDRIKVYHGEMKAEPGLRYSMLVAHEIADAGAGHAVTGAKDALDRWGHVLPQQVDYSKFVPDLIARLQRAARDVADLQERVADLERV